MFSTRNNSPRVNVLMVDDEPANLLALEAVLGDLDLNLIRAESGKEALRQVLKFDFAVILMDVRMPGMDGFEAASLIRSRAHSKETPIIFLTGLDPSQAQLFRGYEVGAVDYLVKPIVPEILRSKVSVFVDLHNKALEIKAQERKYRTIFESFPDIYFSTDMQGRLTLVSPSVFSNLGYKESELIGELISRLYYEPDEAESVIEKIRSEGAVKDVEVCLMTKDGRRVEFSLTARVQSLEGDGAGGVEGVLHDITERKEIEQLRAEESLREHSKILQSVLDSMGDGVVVADTLGNFLLCNPAAEQITGSSPYGLTPEQWAEQYAAYRPDMVTPYPIHQRPLVRAMHGEPINGEEVFIRTPTHPGGIWLSVTGRPLKGADDKVRGGVAVFRDITETKRGEQRLTYLAQYDHLTGLPNRNLFRDRLNQAIARAERNNLLVALMFLDLDKFKNINDTLGHAAGDQLLKAVAERLTRCVRHSDTVARLGGDEFTVILEGRSTVEHVNVIAQKILEAMVPHFTLGAEEVHISCSIGIASAFGPGSEPQGKADGDQLIKNADIAMYRAKELGRNNFQHYVPEMHTATMEKLVAGNKIRRALDKDELLLYYQPQIDVVSRKIIGAEALLRWKPTGSDLLSPAEFMDLAEETGSIVSIGEWMLHSVCKQNKTWQEAGLPFIPIAINFSPQQLQQSNLIPLIRQVLEDTRLEAKYLDIEITEGQVMADVEAAIQTMSELKVMGITISVDDFGTGYSSLNYLKHFPLDTLKLDQTFIRNLPDDAQDAAIASTIMLLAHSLNFRVIAEGVETEAQLNFLAERDCDGVQGALFSPPIPPDEFARLLYAERPELVVDETAT